MDFGTFATVNEVIQFVRCNPQNEPLDTQLPFFIAADFHPHTRVNAY